MNLCFGKGSNTVTLEKLSVTSPLVSFSATFSQQQTGTSSIKIFQVEFERLNTRTARMRKKNFQRKSEIRLLQASVHTTTHRILAT